MPGDDATPFRVLIAGGKTGGHLFPALAIAEEFRRRVPETEIMFAGTKGGLEEHVLSREGYPLAILHVRPLVGVSVPARVLAMVTLMRGMLEAVGLVRGYKPDVTIGVGSFVAGPIILAAWLARRVCVIEDADAYPGFTNRISARFADRVCIGFDDARAYFPEKKTRVTGIPLRKSFTDRAVLPATEGAQNDAFVVLVVGGSQGAHALNECVIRMLECDSGMGSEMYFIHQSGRADEDMVRTAYARSAVNGEVHAFIEDMPDMYRRASVIVCRAGAVTLAELAVMGVPALLVPFPAAAGDHQTKNAMSLANAGAAMVIPQSELTPKRLAEELRALRDDEQARVRLSAAARQWARPDAASAFVDECCAAMRERNHPAPDALCGEGA